MEDVIEAYKSSLEDLTFNSKPHINNLTILAEENKQYAARVVQLIEVQLSKAQAKLPVMYLLDSIIKNVGENYKPLFAKNIVTTFQIAFESSDDKSKMSLYKLRSTWDDYFPLKKLHALDSSIHGLDPNWPVKPLPAHLQDGSTTNIHINPKFLKKTNEAVPVQKLAGPSTTQTKSVPKRPTSDVDKIKQQLVQQQKELLELKEKKLMLELEQTKQQLEAKQKELKHNVKKQVVPSSKDPRSKSVGPKVASNQVRVAIPNDKASVKTVGPKNSAPKDPRLQKSDVAKSQVSLKSATPNSAKVLQATETQKSSNQKKNKKSDTQKTKEDVDKSKDGPRVLTDSPVKAKGNIKKKLQQPAQSQDSSGEAHDHDKRKKRSYRNNKPPLSPTPPPSKIARNVSPAMSPSMRISPDATVKRSQKVIHEKENKRVQMIKERSMHQMDSSRSNEDSLSPAFSPEPDADDISTNVDWTPPTKRSRQAGGVQRLRSFDLDVEIPKELTLSHQKAILQQADVQFRNGQITHEHYQELLKRLHELFELQRVRKLQTSKGSHPADPRMLRAQATDPLPGPMYHTPQPHGPFRHGRRSPLMPSELDSLQFDRSDRAPVGPRSGPIYLDGHSKVPSNGSAPPMRNDDPRRKPPRNASVPNFNKRSVHNDPRQLRRSSSPTQRMSNLSPPDFMRKEVNKHELHGRHTSLRKSVHADRRDARDSESMSQENSKVRQNVFPQEKDAASFGANPAELGKVNLEEPEDYIIANMPSSEVDETSGLEEPEDYIIANIKDKGDAKVACEEPEDYIIAGMPPESEAYHKHAVSLKIDGSSEKVYRNHMKKIKTSKYTKELHAAKQIERQNNELIEDATSKSAAHDDDDDDATAGDKKADDALKSPPLPLKKRKYVNKTKEGGTQQGTADESSVPADIEPGNDKAGDKQSTAKQDERDAVNVTEVGKSDARQEKPHSKLPPRKEKRPKNILDREQLDREQRKPVARSSAPKAREPTNDSDSLVYIIDEEDTPRPGPRSSPPPPPFRRDFDRPIRGRMHVPRRGGRLPRELEEEEEVRIRRMLEDEKNNLEWEDSLHRQLELEERRSNESRHRRPFDRRGRARGPPLPPERWGSPERLGEFRPPFDIARGRIPGRPLPPPHRHGPEPHFPPPPRERGPPRREFRREPGFRGLSPPPPDFLDRRRPRSPPERRPPPRHDLRPYDVRDDRWDMRRGPPPGPDFREMPPFRPIEERLPPPPSEHPLEAPPPPARQVETPMNQVNVDKLLSDLLNMGILPEIKKEATKAPTPAPPSTEGSQSPQQSTSVPSNIRTEPVAVEVKDEKPEVVRSISPLEDDLLTIDPDANIPEISFSSDMKIRHDEIIKRLYTGIQCSACGLRFTTRQTDIYAEHLDWHYRLNRKDKEGGAQAHREIYPSAGDWICHEEIEDPQERAKSAFFEGEEAEREDVELNVPLTGKSGEDACKVCKEAFETFYNETEDEWQFSNCVKVDGDNFHPSCYGDYYDGHSMQTPVKTMPLSAFKPIAETDGIPGLEMTEIEATVEKTETTVLTHNEVSETEVTNETDTKIDEGVEKQSEGSKLESADNQTAPEQRESDGKSIDDNQQALVAGSESTDAKEGMVETYGVEASVVLSQSSLQSDGGRSLDAEPDTAGANIAASTEQVSVGNSSSCVDESPAAPQAKGSFEQIDDVSAGIGCDPDSETCQSSEAEAESSSSKDPISNIVSAEGEHQSNVAAEATSNESESKKEENLSTPVNSDVVDSS